MGELRAEDGAEKLDFGTLLLNMALDVPPPVPVPDAMPPVCSLLDDAIWAAIVAAANERDCANDAEVRRFYEERQALYRDVVKDGA